MSSFETFGQFTIGLTLRLAASQFVVIRNMRDQPLRLHREWLEKGESRIFWLDDVEHIGIRMRAQQANNSSQDQAVDAEENIWDVYVEGINGNPPFLMHGHILIVFQNSYTVLSHSW